MNDIKKARQIILAAVVFNAAAWMVAAMSADQAAGRGSLDGPAALVGLVSPVISYRLFTRYRDGGGMARAAAIALSFATGASIVCLVAYILSRNVMTLTGPVMLLLTACAVWPGRRSADTG